MPRTFSEHSYGFRPNSRGHDAVRKVKGYIPNSYRWVVDIGSEKFFDRVNHDKLMGLLTKKVDDKNILSWLLIIQLPSSKLRKDKNP